VRDPVGSCFLRGVGAGIEATPLRGRASDVPCRTMAARLRRSPISSPPPPPSLCISLYPPPHSSVETTYPACSTYLRSPAMTVLDAESRFHVLAVDDSIIDRKLIEMLLKSSSYQGEPTPPGPQPKQDRDIASVRPYSLLGVFFVEMKSPLAIGF
jgi:hypothetical protein